MEFLIAFLSHTFTETQRIWSTTEQETYGVYYVVTKWNYYLQGIDIIVKNDHKPFAKFLNGKNANNKVNIWSLELATYNITFKSNCQHHQLLLTCSQLCTLMDLLPIVRSHTKKDSAGTTLTPHPDVTPDISPDTNQAPKSLMVDRLEALFQI